MIWLYPVRHLIPLSLVLLSLPLVAVTYLWSMRDFEVSLEQLLERRAAYNSKFMAAVAEGDLRIGTPQQLEYDMQHFAALPALNWALLADAAGDVRYATKADLVGHGLRAPVDPVLARMMAEARSTASGLTGFSTDRQVFWGVYPVRMPLKQDELRAAANTGVIVLSLDAQGLRMSGESTARIQASRNIGMLVVLALLTWLSLRWVLVRRLEALADAARARVLGENQGSLLIEGHDEIADLARRMDELISEVGYKQDSLRESEDRFRTIFDWINDAIFIHDFATGRIIDVNQRMCEMYGYTREEALRLDVEAYSAGTPPYTGQDALVWINKAARGEPQTFEWLAKDKAGRLFWVEVSMRRAKIGEEDRLLVSVRDIQERKQAEAQFQRLTDLHVALSQTNEAIVRCTSQDELFSQVCRIAVEHGKLCGAWIGMLDQATGMVPVVASFNMDQGYLDALHISIDPQSPGGHGPSALVLRNGQYYVCDDFLNNPVTACWHAYAEKVGIRSSAVFPLRRSGQVVGIINLYAAQPHFFTADLLALLDEMAADISFSLDNYQRERQRREAEGELRLAALVFESSREVIIITDAARNIIKVNKAFTDVTGYSAEEAIGRNPRLLKSDRQNADFYQQMWQSINSVGYWYGELWNRRKNGEAYPAWATISVMRDEQGEVVHYLSVSADITEHKESEERIRHMAYYDALTGLPNRTLLRDRADQAINHAQRERGEVALLFLDLDHFKTINDSLGHMVGDKLLQAVAERIQHLLRHVDTVGRLGGDEFLILLPEDGTGGAARVAQKLLTTIAKPFQLDSHILNVTPSIGISMFPRDGGSFDDLLKNADAAMYKAKESGRNSYLFFTPEMNTAAFERLMMENALRNALKNHEFVLYYQPQVEIGSGRVIGVEALIRWQHPELGMVPPAKFIPVAEDSSLIAPIGEWVLQEACRQAKAWQLAGLPPLMVAVNLSTRQFSLGDVLGVVNRALDEGGLAPEYLEVEITESLLAHDLENTLNILNHLKEKGVRVAVDDFGTGYSSLAYLKRFPIHKLKIDQSFVRDLVSDPDDRSIAAAVVNLGHSLGLKVIAEGVETPEQLEILRQFGCDEVQGFYFSQPLPVAEATAYLKEKASLPDA